MSALALPPMSYSTLFLVGLLLTPLLHARNYYCCYCSRTDQRNYYRKCLSLVKVCFFHRLDACTNFETAVITTIYQFHETLDCAVARLFLAFKIYQEVSSYLLH